MCETKLSLPELALIAGTRAALGAGLALLLGDRLPARERKLFGWALLLTGIATTVPLATDVLRQTRSRPEPANSAWWGEMEVAHGRA